MNNFTKVNKKVKNKIIKLIILKNPKTIEENTFKNKKRIDFMKKTQNRIEIINNNIIIKKKIITFNNNKQKIKNKMKILLVK